MKKSEHELCEFLGIEQSALPEAIATIGASLLFENRENFGRYGLLSYREITLDPALYLDDEEECLEEF